MKFLKLVVFASLFACGTSPGDAYRELERGMFHEEEWCGWKAPDPATLKIEAIVDHSQDEVEKFFLHPDGFGITSTYGCFEADETWPGGFCFAPGTRLVRGQLHSDGQNATWVDNMTDEWLSWKNRLNARGWSVSQWVSGQPAPTMNVHTDTTTSTVGVLAESLQNTWTLHTGFDQGDYWTYTKCDVKLYKLRLEANWAYQAASDTQRNRYRHNIWDHEYEHCAGLAHTNTVNLLMSETYTFPGNRFDNYQNPTAAELQMIDDFSPLD